MKILVLGGTTEARHLVERGAGVDWVVSVAGRTAAARAGGEGVRVGGFGGVDGLVDYLRREGVDAVVNATHPFAAGMTRNAFDACRRVGTPLVRLLRPGWEDHPLAGSWTWVADHDAALHAAAGGERIVLTVGRQSLGHYRSLRQVLARVAEDVGEAWPEGWRIVEARGPFAAENERELLRGATHLVSKDSGGSDAKLTVAAELGVQVVMVRRPAPPTGSVVVPDVDGVVAWLTS